MGRMIALLVRGMQVIIAAVLGVGIAARDPRVAVNAALALVGTFVPAILARDLRVRLGPIATIWITGALCLHVLGMVGAYEAIRWWDHLTHFVSASLVAAIAYTVVTAVDRQVEDLYLPAWAMSVLLLLWTVGLGVLWEVMEFVGRGIAREIGREPILVQYGLDDTMLDLAFNGLGGLVIAVVGPDRLDAATSRLERRLRSRDEG
jgi:hypothetical protein